MRGHPGTTPQAASGAVLTLDTSGAVYLPRPGHCYPGRFEWSMLSPFEQGYVEALFASMAALWPLRVTSVMDHDPGFSDLAPETLAAIRKDCAERVSRPFGTKDITDMRPIHEAGARFWLNRQERLYDAFPPLVPYLDDAGKVCLRVAAPDTSDVSDEVPGRPSK